MFSGLIEELGTLSRRKGAEIGVKRSGAKVKLGDSVAVNGVCLTVTRKAGTGKTHEVFFDLSPETLEKSTLGSLKVGSPVNLETSLTLAQGLGGHLVQGHVDGVGRVERVVEQDGGMKTIWFKAPPHVSRYLVPKGSVTVDGVSLTSAELKGDSFSVALIPYTLSHTTLGRLAAGDKVNLEADVIGKYVAKYLDKK